MNLRKVIGNPLSIVLVVSLSVLVIFSAYSNQLPPISVVESGSMQHSSTWTPGVINTGDLIMEKKVSNPVQDVVTYVQGRSTNFTTYGDYGEVILYDAPGNYSIVHRAMFYLDWNGTYPVVVGYSGQSWINITRGEVIIKDVGYSHRNLIVSVSSFVGQSGFITMGDNNLGTSSLNVSTVGAFIAADQNIFGFSPIKPSSVTGIAYGHIPWAGLIKLNIMRVQGDWQYYNDVPQYSYFYLSLSISAILAGLIVSLYLLDRNGKKKALRRN
ncbi:MAG TPA: S26 family signal peptidase [Thermoplasmataceae archaeon]|nr:S26 family signal peptidase [Thermoplasmataceae archaeon]